MEDAQVLAVQSYAPDCVQHHWNEVADELWRVQVPQVAIAATNMPWLRSLGLGSFGAPWLELSRAS